MSEFERRAPEAQLAADLQTAIEPDWRDFERLADGPAVQAFCAYETRYLEGRLTVERPLSIFEFNPTGTHYEPDQAATLLATAKDRVDVFLQSLLHVHSAQKRAPMPEASDSEGICDNLNAIMNGGLDKLTQYMRRSEQLPEENLRVNHQYHIERLSVTLLMLAAQLKATEFYSTSADRRVLEADAPQAEIDAAIDQALQEACQKIARDEKHQTPKDADSTDKLFGSAMNIVRTLYWQGKDKGLQRQIFNTPIAAALAPEINRDDFPTHDAFMLARQTQAFEALATYMNSLIGTTYTYPGVQKLNKMFLERDRVLAQSQDEKGLNNMVNVYLKVAGAHAARLIVDGIADGTMRYSEITRATMQLYKLPLQAPEHEPPELPEQMVEWEVLPQDEIGPRDEQYEPASGDRRPIPLDMTRIDRLREYARGWEGAYMVRGTPAGATGDSMRRQYYVLVLPQKLSEPLPDGTTHIEHAIADSPKLGHGLYIFRAEIGQQYQPALTWREVFSQKRGQPVKQLGALCLRHIDSLEDNLLNALTCPPQEIEKRRRYLQDQRALRLARKAPATDETF